MRSRMMQQFARPALRAVVLHILAIMMSMLMVNVAHASGTVSPVLTYCLYSSLNPWARPVCGLSSADAACALVGTTARTTTGTYGGCLGYYYWTASPTTTCPANTTSATPPCACADPYVANPTATNCIIPACPAHASRTSPGAPCVCDSGYEFDAAGTSCIPEAYAISLVIPPPAEVMPGASKSAYAEVTKSDGAPKGGAQVTLILTVEPEEDGQPYGAHVGSVSPNGGSTGADGRLDFRFTAPTAGGTHTVHAGCTNCTNVAEETIRVPGCPIPPLTSPPFTDPVAQGFENGNRWRSDLLTADYQTKLACVQSEITEKHGTYTGTSAYRPTEYQRHLYEVVQKDVVLKPSYMAAHPECQALRNQVTREMGPSPGHGLGYNQEVAIPGTSRHESGTAFDLTPHGLTDAQLTEVYTTCHVTHTAVPGEPWHTQ